VTPERIVSTAADLADRNGLAATSLSAVAAELGVRVPSLYKHVDGLEDVQHQVGVQAAVELGGELARAVEGKTGRDALHAAASCYRNWADAHPGRYAAIPLARSGEPEIRRGLHEALVGYDGEVGSADQSVAAVYSALHGYVTLAAAGALGAPADRDASFVALVEVLDRGLRAPTAAGAPGGGFRLPGLSHLAGLSHLPGLSRLPRLPLPGR
jgi:AcrR family transcriptional regulator